MAITWTVFRRRYRGKPAKRYTIQVRMPDGTQRQRIAFTDKGASQQLATRWVRELERREVGLHDPFGDARRAPIAEHVDAFLLAMQNGTLGRRRRGRVSEAWVDRCRKRLQDMLKELGATRLEHLNLGDAEQLLHGHAVADWSAKTRDHHAALLRQFGTWLVDDGRWPANPFHRLRPIADRSTVTFRRRALTREQLAKLVEAAQVRGVQEYAKVNPAATPAHVELIRFRGRERAVLYQVAAFTGLRRGEITALRWADLAAGDEPALMVRAETTKNRRAARLELPTWLGRLLEELRADLARHQGRPPAQSDRMFRASYRHLTERMKLDAVWARIGAWDATRSRVLADDGCVIDFHALRGTCATLISEAGMGLKQIEQHMRHSDARLTMEVYMAARRELMRAEVERLAPPTPADTPAGSRPALADDGRERPGDETTRRAGT